MENNKKNKIWAVMLSDEPGKQCDIFCKGSIHEMDPEATNNKLANKMNHIPLEYPYFIITDKPKTKKCSMCNNEFELTAEFIQDGEENNCIRCTTRKYVPAEIRERLVVAIQNELKDENLTLQKIIVKHERHINKLKRVMERRLSRILSMLEQNRIKSSLISDLREQLNKYNPSF